MHTFGINEPARYHIEIAGHLDSTRKAWFENLTFIMEFDEDGTPITIMEGEVRDQAMLHGLLIKIRDLGLPLLAVKHVKSDGQTET